MVRGTSSLVGTIEGNVVACDRRAALRIGGRPTDREILIISEVSWELQYENSFVSLAVASGEKPRLLVHGWLHATGGVVSMSHSTRRVADASQEMVLAEDSRLIHGRCELYPEERSQ